MESISPLLCLLLWRLQMSTTQNVLVVCDFDMRCPFVVAGWPSSVHDTGVFNEALQNYDVKFPFPLEGKKITTTCFYYIWHKCANIYATCVGKYCLVDLGYPNRKGFLFTIQRREVSFTRVSTRSQSKRKKKKSSITCTHHYAMWSSAHLVF